MSEQILHLFSVLLTPADRDGVWVCINAYSVPRCRALMPMAMTILTKLSAGLTWPHSILFQ